jgi:hypothetical protein
VIPLAVEDAPHEQAPVVVVHEVHEFNLYGPGHGVQVPTVSAVVLHGVQETTEHVVALHEPDVAVEGNSDDVAVVVDSDDNIESEHDSDGDLNSESFIIDFQRLSINDSADNIENNVERVNHNDLRLSKWQEILCRLSSDILLREHKVISKEKTISLHESRSRLLECIICMEDICSIIIFPCKHFIMCKPCFDTLTENSDVRHSCPLCRTIIQSNSHVFLA